MNSNYQVEHGIGKVKGPINIRKQKKPELQFHAAASLVMPGDPYGLSKEERADKIDEIIQVAGRFPEHWTGNVRRAQVDQVFEELKEKIIVALRERGVMKAGE